MFVVQASVTILHDSRDAVTLLEWRALRLAKGVSANVQHAAAARLKWQQRSPLPTRDAKRRARAVVGVCVLAVRAPLNHILLISTTNEVVLLMLLLLLSPYPQSLEIILCLLVHGEKTC